MQTTSSEADGDGRARRRSRNRIAVLDAVIELVTGGDLDPTSEDIAAVAGISHRSIYRYFDHRADLLDAAVGRVVEQVRAALFFTSESDASFDVRVDQFVQARLDAQTGLHPVIRAATAHERPTAELEQLRALRSALRAQLAAQFAAELEQLDAQSQRLVTALLDTMFQSEGIARLLESLDHDHELSEALSQMLRRTLSVDGVALAKQQ
ncbi:MAG: TetR/AcrR family transcriptional regulator [Ilumatobacter sp.]